MLKTDQSLGGESLSYLDMMERNLTEDRRRARERQIMEEGQVPFLALGFCWVLCFDLIFKLFRRCGSRRSRKRRTLAREKWLR